MKADRHFPYLSASSLNSDSFWCHFLFDWQRYNLIWRFWDLGWDGNGGTAIRCLTSSAECFHVGTTERVMNSIAAFLLFRCNLLPTWRFESQVTDRTRMTEDTVKNLITMAFRVHLVCHWESRFLQPWGIKPVYGNFGISSLRISLVLKEAAFTPYFGVLQKEHGQKLIPWLEVQGGGQSRWRFWLHAQRATLSHGTQRDRGSTENPGMLRRCSGTLLQVKIITDRR